MPRIRTVKPEFWDSPSTAKASPWARLLFIAMWNWADDYGRGTANLKELEGFAFPNDTFPMTCSGNTVHFRDAVAEVSECFDVTFYEVHGRPYYVIPTWDAHQRNERRAKESKHPGPDHPDALTSSFTARTDDARCFRSDVAETPNTSGPGTGEQGNRGTGEQKTLVRAPRERTTDPEPEGFADFYAAYPRKEKRRTAAAAYARALRRTDAQTILLGTVRFANDPNLPEKNFIPHPATWLNADSWDDDPLPKRERPQKRDANPLDKWQHAFSQLGETDHLQIEAS